MDVKMAAKKIKRFVVDVPVEFHYEVKKRALKFNVSLQKYIIGALLEAMKTEDKYK